MAVTFNANMTRRVEDFLGNHFNSGTVRYFDGDPGGSGVEIASGPIPADAFDGFELQQGVPATVSADAAPAYIQFEQGATSVTLTAGGAGNDVAFDDPNWKSGDTVTLDPGYVFSTHPSPFGVPYTQPSNATVIIPDTLASAFVPNSEIAAFDMQGHLIGRFVVPPAPDFPAAFAVAAYSANDDKGLQNGDPFSFEVWQWDTGERRELTITWQPCDASPLCADGAYEADKIFTAGSFSTGALVT